jgi:protein phosphatase
MLICPQCESENPDNNKFCQQCGNSLIQKPCGKCGTKVDYGDENCPNCGASTATFKWAIISPSFSSLFPQSPVLDIVSPKEILSDQAPESSPIPLTEEIAPETNENLSESEIVTARPTNAETEGEGETTDNKVEEVQSVTPINDSQNQLESLLNQILVDGEYLDRNKRYRLVKSAKESLLSQFQAHSDLNLIGVQVIDTKPVQESQLDYLIRQLGESEDTDDEINENQGKIPSLVKPYLSLSQYGFILPRVDDGWQDEEQNVLILEDRSQYLTLSEYLKNDSIPLPQILYWMREMASLWDDLGEFHHRQSLFQLDNLCLDEDITFCLKQLYQDGEDQEFSLENLVLVWQSLLKDSGRESEEFTVLVENTQKGLIFNAEQLCEELEIIARHELGEENFSTDFPQELEESDGEISPEDVSDSDLVTIVHKNEANSMNYSSEGDDIPTIVLPMQLLSLSDSGITDIGLQRDHNEDFFGLQTSTISHANPVGRFTQARGLYIVCDGMGGHDAGEVASAMAVEKLQNYFKIHWQDELPDEDTIKDAILVANQAIYDVNMENSRSGSGRMGTTLVMALVQDTKVAIAHVGDSRAYRVTRKKKAEQITIDHEVGQREIQRGVEPEIAYGRPDAYQLTQALGPRNNDFVQPDICFFDINEDTVLLLCSDGLCDNDLVETSSDTYLSPLLSSRVNLDQELLKLIDFANQHNGHDNITAVAIQIKVRPNMEQIPAH